MRTTGAGGIEMRCRECGCTDTRACDGGCFWVEPELCSQCSVPLLRQRLQALECGNRVLAMDAANARFVQDIVVSYGNDQRGQLAAALKELGRTQREHERRLAGAVAFAQERLRMYRGTLSEFLSSEGIQEDFEQLLMLLGRTDGGGP